MKQKYRKNTCFSDDVLQGGLIRKYIDFIKFYTIYFVDEYFRIPRLVVWDLFYICASCIFLLINYNYKALYETNIFKNISEIPKKSKAGRLSAFDFRTG